MTLEIEITDENKKEGTVDVDFREGTILANVTFRPHDLLKIAEIIQALLRVGE